MRDLDFSVGKLCVCWPKRDVLFTVTSVSVISVSPAGSSVMRLHSERIPRITLYLFLFKAMFHSCKELHRYFFFSSYSFSSSFSSFYKFDETLIVQCNFQSPTRCHFLPTHTLLSHSQSRVKHPLCFCQSQFPYGLVF